MSATWPTGEGGPVHFRIEYADGLTSDFRRQPDGSWLHTVGEGKPYQLRVSGYDAAKLMRVVSCALEKTREIAS